MPAFLCPNERREIRVTERCPLKWRSSLRSSLVIWVESARDEGLGITVSYWDSLEAIRLWKENAAHQVAQERGKNEWYESFGLRICKVERDSFYKL